MLRLARVEAIVEATTRGCFLVFPSQWTADLKIRTGDGIQLRTPNGGALDTYIAAIEITSGPGASSLAVGLPRDLSKSDVPPGTEIWLVEKEQP